jgi:hypothetical protein
MVDYNTLLSVVRGKAGEILPKPRQQFAKAQIAKSEAYLADYVELDAKTKYKGWLEETSGWYDHPDNVEYKWETEERLYPYGNFRAYTTDRINTELNTMKTPLERQTYFQNAAPVWPSWLMKEYEYDIERDRNLTEARNLELSRINNKLSTEDILNEVTTRGAFFLDGGVSMRMHAEDLQTALTYGYTTEIHTAGGRFVVPLDGQLKPVFSLSPESYPEVDPSEEYILLSDTYKMIEKAIKPYHAESLEDIHGTNVSNSKALYENIHRMGRGYEDFHNNIILDYAITQSNPFDIINTGLENKIYEDISVGMYETVEDAVVAFMDHWTSLLETLEKRS